MSHHMTQRQRGQIKETPIYLYFAGFAPMATRFILKFGAIVGIFAPLSLDKV